MIHRLKEVRKELGFNQTDFAKHLGITQTAYSMIENGNRPLADKYVKVICSAFNVNENWFITGEGEMFLSSPYEKEFIDIFSRLAPDAFLHHAAFNEHRGQQRERGLGQARLLGQIGTTHRFLRTQ